MIKKISLIFGLIALGLLTSVMVFSAIFPKPASGQSAESENFCAEDKNNIYMNPDLSTEEVMSLYHETINEKFNENIKRMLQGQKSAAEANKADPNNRPPQDGQTCDENNYSTYCVAVKLLSNGEYGYMEYTKALNCRRTNLFETAKESNAWQSYSDAMIIGTENEQDAQTIYQGQKVLEINARLDAINREIQSSKQALDKTLAVYEELKTAWPMHQRYIQIYNNLIKYRDKLVEIRHQIEIFPAKFIDVTTTLCT